MRRAIIVLILVGGMVMPAWAEPPYWAVTVKEVHNHFTGLPGTIARFGDSITVSLAFFKPLQWTTNLGAATQAVSWIRGYVNTNPTPNNNCWNWADDSQPPYYTGHDYEYKGAMGGKNSNWPFQTDQGAPNNLGVWLNMLNPEMAIIMFGTNDIPQGVSQATYVNNMRQIVQACKNKGTIPILTTIPPRRDNPPKAADFAQAIRDLAVEQKVPYIDYHQEIMTRRPGLTWYNTLISGDGVHPTYTSNDFSENTLNNSGYTLRSYVTVLKAYEVYNIMTAMQGDTDFDGDVDFQDYQTLEARFGMTTGATWADGDTDFDGDVDFADYQRLENNFGHAVPEPACLLLLTAGLGLLRRHR